MKKILCVVCVLTMMLSMSTIGVFAYGEIQSGEWEYKINDNGDAIITSVNQDINGDIVIPASVDEYTVVGVGEQAFIDNTKITSVVIPNSVVEIEKYAFMNCYNLTRVEFGSGLKVLGESTFVRCTKLTDVVFAEDSQLESIGTQAFLACEALQSITFPDSVTKIENGAFRNCKSLSQIDFNNVSVLGNDAFSGCDSLVKLEIPETIKNISDTPFAEYNGAFWGCENLKYVTIFSGMTSIPKGTFYDSRELSIIYIDKGELQVIDEGAFLGCNKISKVFFSGTEQEWESIASDKVFGEKVEIVCNATYDESLFDEEKGILGDVNGDEKVNIKDATMIQKAAAKILSLTDDENARANVNGDNKVNVKDATAIQKFVAKIETGFPIGEKIT